MKLQILLEIDIKGEHDMNEVQEDIKEAVDFWNEDIIILGSPTGEQKYVEKITLNSVKSI